MAQTNVAITPKQPEASLDFTNLEELEPKAEQVLPRMVYRYYAGGTEGEETLRDNRAVWARYKLLPTVMHNVSKVDCSTTLLGERLALPVAIAPMSMQKLAHPDGEVAVARAAAGAQIPMIVSTLGTTRMDEVQAAAKGAPAVMFQLYVFTNRENTVRLIRDAEAAGYKALCVTVDVPVLSNREDDTRNKFKLPGHLKLANLPDLEVVDRELKEVGSESRRPVGVWHDGSLTWDFIPWIRSHTRLPIFLKGILDPRDAARALEAGVDGLIVSNHGGRQLNFAPAALDVLPGIVEAVGGQIPVWLLFGEGLNCVPVGAQDGGVRRGTDIIKAIALGADGVLVGRPVLFALAVGGEAGVSRALQILRQELELSMALMGCPTIKHLKRSHVIPPRSHMSHL